MALFDIENLTFTYAEAKHPAIEQLCFSVESGEFVVICGKSGCGKSTLLRHFKTALTPYGERQGCIRMLGRPLEQIPIREQSCEIGYVLQNPDNQIVTDKVWHELAFGLENLGCDQHTMHLRVAEMASFFGIESWFHKNVAELSGGQKQLLNLAGIMAMQPRVLILDEPTSQLDPIAAGDFLSTIRKINLDLGVTVILIEHRLEDVLPMADKVLVLENGKQIFYDSPRNVGRALADHDLFLAMPAPVQIYNAVGQPGSCPLTVCEGRQWLESRYLPQTEPPPESQSPKPLQSDPVIQAKGLWFRYCKEGRDILKDLSIQVHKGEMFCILGGNGTGKSTLMKLLCGIHKPYRGKILLEGQHLQKFSSQELFRHFLGMLPQNPQTLFVGSTVQEDLDEMLHSHSREGKEYQLALLEQVIEDTEIQHLLDMHPYDLSGGEQQRAALAKVLLLEPRILLLDEPTKGLDGFYKHKLAEIFNRLKSRGVTILMVSHDVEFCAAYADTCALFFDGSIASSAPARSFFAGNSFYTTAANRMARNLYPYAITAKDVIEACQKNNPPALIPG